jgi:hypothetical protein
MGNIAQQQTADGTRYIFRAADAGAGRPHPFGQIALRHYVEL